MVKNVKEFIFLFSIEKRCLKKNQNLFIFVSLWSLLYCYSTDVEYYETFNIASDVIRYFTHKHHLFRANVNQSIIKDKNLLRLYSDVYLCKGENKNQYFNINHVVYAIHMV